MTNRDGDISPHAPFVKGGVGGFEAYFPSNAHDPCNTHDGNNIPFHSLRYAIFYLILEGRKVLNISEYLLTLTLTLYFLPNKGGPE
jgi:hypothetical protein